MRSDILRVRALDILREQGPLNTCQVCRLLHGRDKDDVDFCRSNKVVERGLSNFTRWGHEPYENCLGHDPKHSEVYRGLEILERKHFVESKRMRRKDPQKKGRSWDIMRMWAVDLSSVLKETISYYCDE